MKGADSQVDIAIPRSNLILDSSFRNELNLSTINPPSNRMQMTPDVVEVRDQNLHVQESNINRIYEGENVRWFTLHQFRDQIMPGPGLITDGNLARENIYDNFCGEVNNQNLHGYNHTRNNMNIVSGRTGSYQPMIANDQVFNPNGAGLDLNNQGTHGGFSSHHTASQFAPRPRVKSS